MNFRHAGFLLLGLSLLLFPWNGLLHAESTGVDVPAPEPGEAIATFAGGCFWCMEHPFDKLEGVKSTTVGYTGGHTKNPSYREVSSGRTGHAEAVRIVYDPMQVSYGKLLNIFWHEIDPTTANRQFCDAGSQYRPAIFYHNQEQKRLAETSRSDLAKNGPFEEPIVVEVVEASTFYPAEEYHQNYYKKKPIRYKFYRWNCGRDQFLEKVWSDHSWTFTGDSLT